MDDHNIENLSWTALSHIQAKRSARWYIFFVLITLGLFAYAFYTRSILTFITFFLIFITVLSVSQAPHEVTYKITKTGIHIGRIVYPFKVIKNFWIVYNPPQVKTLNFETTAYINNRVVVQMGNHNPVTIKKVLSQYLTEDLEKEESFSETLARRLKI